MRRAVSSEVRAPRQSGICDRCGGKLTQRADDTAETVQKRLEVYRQLTLDVVSYYEKAGILKRVDGGQPKDKVSRTLWGYCSRDRHQDTRRD